MGALLAQPFGKAAGEVEFARRLKRGKIGLSEGLDGQRVKSTRLVYLGGERAEKRERADAEIP